MNTELKLQFHKDMLNIYHRAKKECQYSANRFLQMLTSPDESIQVAKRFASDPKLHEGFINLWEKGRLDLTVEAHMIQEQYQSLFKSDEIEAAKHKLKELGYQ